MKTKTLSSKPAHASPAASRAGRPFFQKKDSAKPAAALSQAGRQHKLVVGRPGDPFETEADAMADAVTGRAPTPGRTSGNGLADHISPLVQRQAEEEPMQAQAEDKKKEEEPLQAQAEEKEEPVQAQAEEEKKEEPLQAQAEEKEEPVQAEEEKKEEPVQAQVEEKEEPLQAQAEEEKKEEPLQAQAEGEATLSAPEFVGEQLRAQRGYGSPLAEDVRTNMENRFGADFSGIRIHTDEPAVQLTRLLKAKAFTQGRDIYFNEGNFAPATGPGQHLLAHELTHTIQQGAVQPGELQRQAEPATVQRQEDGEATMMIRPELLDAIRLARREIGQVNAKQTNADRTRQGWERLYEYFSTALGQKDIIHQDIIKFIHKVKQGDVTKDSMPSWCGIFVWWAYKQAGIPIPDWKLGESILKWVVPRKLKELPRKGDIAYKGPQYNDHFALVSGVESPQTAEGKDFKSVRVATVNGNTAGEDNLGGQVQEKWEPIGKWLAFFDPVAKLDMPPVPLVKTGVEPDAPTEEEAVAAAAVAAEPAPETPPTNVEHLEEDIVTTPDVPASGEADVAVELPEPPAVPQAEEVAQVETLALEGSSDEAMVGFVEASPSQMAVSQPLLGEKLDTKINEEKQTEVENAPVLTVQTSGTVEEGLTPPDQIPLPGDAQITDGVTGPEPDQLEVDPHQNRGETPSNDANEKLLDEQEEGGFLSWLRDNITNFLKQIRTKDPGLNTSAGERPNVQLEGEADPERMTTQRDEAQGQLQAQRDASTTTFKNHPGQQNIQPKEVHQEKTAPLSPEVPVTIETPADTAVADYANAPLPADVRDKADELLQPDLESNLAEAKTKTEQAAQQRDDDKAAEISQAETEAAKINQQADQEQRDIVITNRKIVAGQQKAGIEEAYGHVNEFTTSADKEQTTARKDIGEKVKDSESKARDELDKGETDAEKKKEDGEKEAADKKKELEENQEEDSWWDRAVGAIKKAVKAITEAIDVIFTKIREAVKTIIEKAKQAAIGLINAARDWVVDKLNKFRDWAKGMVDKYLKEHFPELAKRINEGIDATVDLAIDGVNFVADTAIKTVEALADGLAAALDKVLQVFQTALKAAVQIAGAVLTGDFAEALRVAIQAACDIVGIDSQPIFDFIDRAAAQIMQILKDPKTFLNNVMAAVGGGVRSFVKNIKKHLITGLIGWLTGALSEVPITLPETFDGKGIFSLVMQILGLTYDNIKARVIKRYPPAATVFSVVEKGFEILKKLVTEGPIALWEEVKQSLADFKEMVLSGIRSFVITTVVKEAITWLLGLLNPAGALVKILKLIYDFVMFLIERFEQIKDFIMSVYNSLSAIAAGNLTQAQQAVEDALGRSLPVVIGLLASLAGLRGIGKTVKEIIGKVSKPVNKIIDKIIDRVIAFAKKLLKQGKAAAKKVKEAALSLIKWWTKKKSFQDKTGSSHKLYYKGKSTNAQLFVASFNPAMLDKFFDIKSKEAATEGGANFTQSDVTAARNYYTGKVVPLEKKLSQVDQTYTGGAGGTKLSAEKKAKGVNENKKLVQDLEQALAELGNNYLNKLFGPGSEDYPPPKLPVMADNKKASSFTADYIVKGEKFKVEPGTESGAHVGNLEGWSQLQAAKLTDQSKWVRMHLLPHKLGGNAVDSNLTPARGPKSNIPFSSAVEQPAIKAAVEGPVKQNKPIWYRFRIDYYSGKASPFPKYLKAEWGHYERANGQPKRGPVVKAFAQTPAEPEFTPITPNLNDPQVTTGEIAAVSGVDRSFVQLLFNVRTENGGSLGITGAAVKMRMEKKYVEIDAVGNRRYRFGVENFDTRLNLVMAAISAGKIVLT